jgi:glycosyltransferase involved in cell wall biosynthesis
MRLLITTDTVGGVWTYTRELSQGLLSRGHQVLLVSMGRAPSHDQRAWTSRTLAGWPGCFQYVSTDHPLEWMQSNAACYCDAEAVLLEQIDRFLPDALHLNQFCYGALPTSVPKIVIAHSDVMSWSECCRGAYPEASPWLHKYLGVVRAGLAQANAVVAPTQWMLDALCRNYIVPPNRVVIPNGRLLPPRPPIKRNLQAITIGRVWDEGKNVRMLEDVISPMPLLVAGELALEAEPPFTSSHLELLGPLTEDDTLTLFAESSVYIITSRYEPFGLAPLEAALSGCAIVAHDIPSLREVWDNSALYFRNAEELSAHLQAMHADPRSLTQTARRACTRARSLYSQDTMIENYLNLYTSVCTRVEEAEAQHVS